jgi:hypothetical protein
VLNVLKSLKRHTQTDLVKTQFPKSSKAEKVRTQAITLIKQNFSHKPILSNY